MLCYAMPCFAMRGVDQCNQVRALTAGLMSTAVSSAVTVLGRHAFKAATKFGEGGRAIKMHKFQRNQLLFETFEEEHIAAVEDAEARKSMHDRTSSRRMLKLKSSGVSTVFSRSRSSGARHIRPRACVPALASTARLVTTPTPLRGRYHPLHANGVKRTQWQIQ